jgi:hypothetical protein
VGSSPSPHSSPRRRAGRPRQVQVPGGTGFGGCYWARLKNGNGELGDIRANNIGEGQMILNVQNGDGFVEVRGCTFTKA